VDYGGTDKGTIDWFRWIDRNRFSLSLFTTQASNNSRLAEVFPHAEEVWPLPELCAGYRFPQLIVDFIDSRAVELIHIMNSRMAFDLLPDLRALKRPPRVVVQLHVEEPTRDGYVRYVATRYGNLVDAFSVVGPHLADIVHDYGVSRDRITVIPLGVDAEDEFSPERVSPRSGFEPGVAHILYAGRLVPQKDPFLMVSVAAELRARDLAFKIHAVGGGELETQVRQRVEDAGLGAQVAFYPPTEDLAPWYAAADMVLMTSAFEGVPLVLYEALAMATPAVVPALPGNLELIGGGGGLMVDAGAAAAAYADALALLVTDPAARARIGAEGRSLVRESYSVRQMAERHEQLYDELLSRTPVMPLSSAWEALPLGTEKADGETGAAAGNVAASTAASNGATGAADSAPITFLQRPSRGTPLVSVVMPCFDHGPWLREGIESVLAQSYPAVEMVVVDDGSTESETVAILDELERDERVMLIRMRRNRGPRGARNCGLDRAAGRYILLLDPDKLLEPHALERLVAQLQGAGERVGFTYPSIQYVGNREELFEPPAFNAWLLTRGNYIDTSALFDREVFEHGFRFNEDVVLGDEDWEFFLALAAAGVRGEPARGTSLLYRRHGFTRPDLADAGWRGTRKLVARRSASSSRGLLKSRWAPALTIVALGASEVGAQSWDIVQAGLTRQKFTDFELFAAVDRDVDLPAELPPVRRIPPRLLANRGQTLVHVLEITEAPHVAVTYGTGAELFTDPGSVDRLVRLLEQGDTCGLVAFADVGAAGRFPWRVISADQAGLELHSLAWSRRHRPLQTLPFALDGGDPLGDLARWQQLRRVSIQWRHLPTRSHVTTEPTGNRVRFVKLPRPRSELSERHSRRDAPTVFPGLGRPMARLNSFQYWLPPSAAPLCRHRTGTGERVCTSSELPPMGYELERCLGSLHCMSFAGTARLVADPEVGYASVPLGSQPDAVELERTLGYTEQVAFAGLDPLRLCRHAPTDTNVLVCGDDDPLNAEVDWPELAVLGWLERVPVNPQHVPTPGETTAWLRGLVRTVDLAARRHRVAIGSVPPGVGVAELGAVLDRDPGDGVALWTDDLGRLHTRTYVPSRYPLSPMRIARWVSAPMTWRDLAGPLPLARATARRALAAARVVTTSHDNVSQEGFSPLGWLTRDDGPDRVAIFSAIQPSTSDQLVTRYRSEAEELGYEAVRHLGYALAIPVLTASLSPSESVVPWATRFGLARSHGGDPIMAS
jgi:glycosyltransferase involved in cell wall biosynthesis